MSDRNKVVRELEHMAGIINQYTDMLSVDCDSWVILDALALLKEQPEIIQCKDCRYYDPDCQICDNGLDSIFPPDWFCADGERKQEKYE